MARLIILMAVTVIVVVFSMSNMRDVHLSLVFGEPVAIRLTFLLGVAYAAGVLSTIFYQTVSSISRKAELRRHQLRAKRAALAKLEET
jgi:uncharacterized integral membrane protein